MAPSATPHRALLHRALAFAALLALVAGCGSQSVTRSQGADSAVVAASDRDTPAPPRGPQVGRSDARLNAIRPSVRVWASLWRAAMPAFTVDSLYTDGVARWRPAGRVHDAGESRGTGVYRATSPDGRRVLRFDSRIEIAPDGDTVRVANDADARTLLVDGRRRIAVVVDSCGTDCATEWAEWVANDVFVLGGTSNAQALGDWKQGTLEVYSLRDSTVARYVTRAVPLAAYAAYDRALCKWLIKRPGSPGVRVRS